VKNIRRFVFILTLFVAVLASPFVLADAQSRTTNFPPSTHPDGVCLTWSDDPCTTETVQWRTAPEVAEGFLQYRKNDAPESAALEVRAEAVKLEDAQIANAPSIEHFTAKITRLTPGTAYLYRVGDKQSGAWSEWAPFTTAPQGRVPFSFLFFADVQNGVDVWGRMIHQMHDRNPRAAFCLTGGDFVNHGNDRTDWDELFHYAEGVFDRVDVVPTIGNHECKDGPGPKLYLDLFALPENGPENVAKERAYSFRYGNALFIVLDGNTSPAEQRPWLEKQLSGADATWKFVLFHQPAYSSDPGRDNRQVREQWCTLFDKYHVDMVFQGHDHAYLRTHPMNAEKIAASPAEGTIYVVADAGTKYYKQEQHDYTAVGFTNVSTCQVISIDTDGGDKLSYRAYDADGKVRDEVVIDKPAK
jgi:acid phosphatase type 7